ATLPRRRWAPMPLSVGFAFTKLVVHDLDAAAAFYCKAYDLHAVRRVRGEYIADEEIAELMLSADPEATFGSRVLLKYLRPPPARRLARAGAGLDGLRPRAPAALSRGAPHHRAAGAHVAVVARRRGIADRGPGARRALRGGARAVAPLGDRGDDGPGDAGGVL